MNAHQRKIIRDAHIRRLGGLGATVQIGKFMATLLEITGHSLASVRFHQRTSAHLPVVFQYPAQELRPAARWF